MVSNPPPYGPPPAGYPPGPPPQHPPPGAPPPRRSNTVLVVVIIAVVAVFVLSVAGVVAWRVLGGSTPAEGVAGGEEPLPGEPRITGVDFYADLPRDHSEDPVDYPMTPPAGGTHHPQWLNCGVYDEPVPNENAVHSLEHGAVWVTYDPGLDPAEVATLEELYQQGSHVLVSPYPGLPASVVVSAWGRQLAVESATDDRVETFVAEYEQGPTTPEPGAPCSGGVDG